MVPLLRCNLVAGTEDAQKHLLEKLKKTYMLAYFDLKWCDDLQTISQINNNNN